MSKKDPSPASPSATPSPAPKQDGARDGIEAVVIAFILAFLFRTFEAEAFVIPTGSMAPGLMGAHHDLTCEVCGYQYQVNSGERDDKSAMQFAIDMGKLQKELADTRSPEMRAQIQKEMRRRQSEFENRRTVEGTCPICRHTMNFVEGKNSESYSGDRLIVTKFPYEFGEPKRFDVAVFKYPLGPSENFIKRIVGLPNENLRLFHGDVFRSDAGSQDPLTIVRKPDEKLLSIAQIVHDNDYVVNPDGQEDAMLKAGWPARWHGGTYQAADGEVKFQRNDVAWKPTDSGRGFNIAAKDAVAGDEWLRYQHVVPSSETWAVLAKEKRIPPESEVPRRPQLISDFYAYNTNQDLNDVSGDLKAEAFFAAGLGLHWVGDLLLECDVAVQEANAQSTITLELVEGSQVDAQGVRVPCRFQCRIDLTSGEAELAVLGIEDADWAKTKRTAKTSVRGPGNYSLRFSNFDDELRLWVNGSRVEFSAPTSYQFPTPETDARNNRPTMADLAPAGINVEGATATVDHLRVKRDIYYIATRNATGYVLLDYADQTALVTNPTELTQRAAMSDPRYFKQFEDVRTVEFTTGPDDFLALGDNSPHSMDSRLWSGEPFVPRRLLIGEALFIYWPHSWMFPVPNVKDMGFVR